MKGKNWDIPRSVWLMPSGEVIMIAAHKVEGENKYSFVRPHPDAKYLGLQRSVDGLIDPRGETKLIKGGRPLKVRQSI